MVARKNKGKRGKKGGKINKRLRIALVNSVVIARHKALPLKIDFDNVWYLKGSNEKRPRKRKHNFCLHYFCVHLNLLSLLCFLLKA